MQSDELQPIIDELAERLGRSVAIDDPTVRLLAASRHFGDEDATRVASVLNRSVSPDLARTVLAHGIREWTSAGRLELPAETGVDPRVLVPIRRHGILLGFLWLIDPQHTLTPREIALAEEASDNAGQVLYRRLLLRDRSRTRDEAIICSLVGPDPAHRAHAASEVTAEQILGESGRVLMVVAQVCTDQADAEDVDPELALELAVEESTRWMPPRSTLTMANSHGARILIALPRGATEALVNDLASRLSTRFAQHSSGVRRLVVGIGAIASGLDGAVDSDRQAMVAVKIARLLPSLGDTLRWDELGPYELLLRLSESEEDLHATPPARALDALAKQDPHGVLRETLEAFLDRAGDVRRTAAHLCVHRATLYHRLNRIQELTGADLEDGVNRLALHLALKLARLAASGWSPETEDDPSHIL